MHSKPKYIKDSELPLEFIGYEKGTDKSVYSLTGMLNVDIRLSLKCSGYANKEVILSTGENIGRAWVK